MIIYKVIIYNIINVNNYLLIIYKNIIIYNIIIYNNKLIKALTCFNILLYCIHACILIMHEYNLMSIITL